MLSETEVIVRATRSRAASVPGELSFSVGDVIVYLPQRGRSGATGTVSYTHLTLPTICSV